MNRTSIGVLFITYSDSDLLRITLLDFFLVLQLVVEGCRFMDTYRGGQLAMLMMT